MKLNYPIPTIKKEGQKNHTATHGVLFENELNLSNEYYRNINKAIIYKKPTPIHVVKVDYPTRSKAKIVEAYYKTPSTTDYNGIYREKYLDFEAKETNNLSFSFKHISKHQIDHLLKIDQHGGIAFVILFFKKLKQVYIIDIKIFHQLYIVNLKSGEKSIKASEIISLGGKQVKLGYTPLIDYLKVVDELYF